MTAGQGGPGAEGEGPRGGTENVSIRFSQEIALERPDAAYQHNNDIYKDFKRIYNSKSECATHSRSTEKNTKHALLVYMMDGIG